MVTAQTTSTTSRNDKTIKRRLFFSANHPLDLVGLEPEQPGPEGAGNHGDVEPLLDHVLDTQQIEGPMA